MTTRLLAKPYAKVNDKSAVGKAIGEVAQKQNNALHIIRLGCDRWYHARDNASSHVSRLLCFYRQQAIRNTPHLQLWQQGPCPVDLRVVSLPHVHHDAMMLVVAKETLYGWMEGA